jgi:hypothetical protein
MVASPALVASDIMYFMSGTPLIDWSSMTSTDSSSTLALAPGNVMFTITTTGATLGNCEIGRRKIESVPRKRINNEITMARAGRCRTFENMGGWGTDGAGYSALSLRCANASLGSSVSKSSAFSPSWTCRIPSKMNVSFSVNPEETTKRSSSSWAISICF